MTVFDLGTKLGTKPSLISQKKTPNKNTKKIARIYKTQKLRKVFDLESLTLFEP